MFFPPSQKENLHEPPASATSWLRNGVTSHCTPAPQLRWHSSTLKQDCRVLPVLEHIKHSPPNAAQKQVKQNKKGANYHEQSIKSAGSPFLSITAMWLLKQSECIELVQVENWFFDQNGKKNKGRGRRELCGQDSLNNRGGFFFFNWRIGKINEEFGKFSCKHFNSQSLNSGSSSLCQWRYPLKNVNNMRKSYCCFHFPLKKLHLQCNSHFRLYWSRAGWADIYSVKLLPSTKICLGKKE